MRILIGILVFVVAASPPAIGQMRLESSVSTSSATSSLSSAELVKMGYRRFEVEQGIITYTLSGSLQRGSRIIYFDRWGLRQAIYDKAITNVFGLKKKVTSIQFLDGEQQYVYNKRRKTYRSTRQAVFAQLLTEKEETENTQAQKGVEAFLIGMGGTKMGKETVMGKPCEIWKMTLGGTHYVWKGMSLRTSSSLFGIETEWQVSKIELNEKVPDRKLLLPKKAKPASPR
ncbi:MAG: hypothetical protein AAF587_30240 [Bacteroidota bacterium]